MLVSIKEKSVYGNTLMYPNNETAILFAQLLNKKTFVIISGIHGDEPAGNKAAEYFKNQKNVYVISNINKIQLIICLFRHFLNQSLL
jgi:hypothetical protein